MVKKKRKQTTTILDTISPFWIINVKIKQPYESPWKKRKLPGAFKAPTSKAIKTTGTITGHYFNFIGSALDVLDKHEQFKHFYVVIDSVPIHKHKDITKCIINRRHDCVYLPPPSRILQNWIQLNNFGQSLRADPKGKDFCRKKPWVQEFLKLAIMFFIVICKAFATILHQNGMCVLISNHFQVMVHFVPQFCAINKYVVCHYKVVIVPI